MDEHWPPRSLTPRAVGCLVHGLDELEAITEAPLRLRGHATSPAHEVFEVQEEFELGPRGRRFLMSIDALRADAMLMAVGVRPADAS